MMCSESARSIDRHRRLLKRKALSETGSRVCCHIDTCSRSTRSQVPSLYDTERSDGSSARDERWAGNPKKILISLNLEIITYTYVVVLGNNEAALAHALVLNTFGVLRKQLAVVE